MVLLSLGPEAIAALLRGEGRREFSGPDLSWLLFGPDTDALISGAADLTPAGVNGTDGQPSEK